LEPDIAFTEIGSFIFELPISLLDVVAAFMHALHNIATQFANGDFIDQRVHDRRMLLRFTICHARCFLHSWHGCGDWTSQSTNRVG
jgi:hypothetical protein